MENRYLKMISNITAFPIQWSLNSAKKNIHQSRYFLTLPKKEKIITNIKHGVKQKRYIKSGGCFYSRAEVLWMPPHSHGWETHEGQNLELPRDRHRMLRRLATQGPGAQLAVTCRDATSANVGARAPGRGGEGARRPPALPRRPSRPRDPH